MITSNMSAGWLYVTPNPTPYISGNAQSGAGMVRFNTGTNCLEITDGRSWYSYLPGGTVDLSSEAQLVLSWARDKMQREAELEQLMQKHPGLRDLHERFEVMLALVQKNDTNGS